MSDLVRLALAFEQFATSQCGGSPLYRRLAEGVAKDSEVLALAAQATNTPRINLLFAAVHYLLLSGVSHPLRGYYHTLVHEVATGDPYPAFRTFCLSHRDELLPLLQSRRVQTNEVARSAFLLPAFNALYQRTGLPLALVEVGCSAGLLLHCDRYRVTYSNGQVAGEAGSTVRFETELRGEGTLPLGVTPPPIASRQGVDLHPIDLTDPDEALWLRALVWGDQPERAARLAAAIGLVVAGREGTGLAVAGSVVAGQEVAGQAMAGPTVGGEAHPAGIAVAQLVAGDALEKLPQILSSLPLSGVTPVIFHCHTLNQFRPEARQAFDHLLCQASQERELYVLALEATGPVEPPEMRLRRFWQGQQEGDWLLARYQAHGEWLEWLAPAELS